MVCTLLTQVILDATMQRIQIVVALAPQECRVDVTANSACAVHLHVGDGYISNDKTMHNAGHN